MHSPLHLVGGLRDEEALRVGLDLGAPRIDRDLRIGSLLAALDLDSQQQQLQFGEAQPTT